MKACLLFVLVFLVSMFVSGQNENISDGPYKQYHKNGKIKTEGQYRNKKRVGEWKSYYDSGDLLSVDSYTDGILNFGESISYFKNGSIKNKTENVDGVYVNKEFYATGKLFYERLPKGGYYKEYFEDGTLKVEGNYSDDALFGTWKQYYPTGKIEWEVDYNNSYKKGPYKLYYENGQLKAEGKHDADKKDGKEIHYDEVGNKIIEINYKDGEIVNPDKGNASFNTIVVPNGVFENVPIYPGCENELGYLAKRKCMNNGISKFVINNFNTKLVETYGLTGKQKIYLIFKINKKGEVMDLDARASNYGLKIEAIRVLELLPKMKPGIQRGKNVIVPFSLPIAFETNK